MGWTRASADDKVTIHALPLTGYAPDQAAVSAHLRELADLVDAGEWGDVRTIVTLLEDADGLLHRATCGKPCDMARVVGLLTIAAARAALDG